jgi:hypothetical protein
MFQFMAPQCLAEHEMPICIFYQTNPFEKSQNINEINGKDHFWMTI